MHGNKYWYQSIIRVFESLMPQKFYLSMCYQNLLFIRKFEEYNNIYFGIEKFKKIISREK